MARSVTYTTRARIDLLLGDDLVAELLDRDQDGTEDAGLFDDLHDRACNVVDAQLRQKYAVPFDDIDDGTLDPMVSDLTDEVLCAILLRRNHPELADEHKEAAEEIFKLLRSGQYELDADKASVGTGKRFIRVESTQSKGTTFAGRDEDGVSKMWGW